MYPIKTNELSKEELKNFMENFADENGEFFFEGMWFRNQREENVKQSLWKDETTVKRRYIHFYDKYIHVNENNKDYLAVKDTYLYVSNTLPREENEEYLQKIINALENNNFVKNQESTDVLYEHKNLQIYINKYDSHPKNEMKKEVFPENYNCIDVIVKTKDYNHESFYNRMWDHSMRIFRVPGTRENPKYVKNVEEILPFLPAQVEMGCGPSIEVGIPPLYDMHETYYVQNHISKQFYFGEQDKLILDIINNPAEMAQKFAYVLNLCVKAKATEAYETFTKLYKKGYFIDTVYNNNFDRIVKRFGIDEIMLRIFEINTYLPKIEFNKDAKSLVVFGSHADRREVQKQAREQGLKIIHIDPEGFLENGEFIPYPVEAPQNDDLVWKVTFTEAMSILGEKLL